MPAAYGSIFVHAARIAVRFLIALLFLSTLTVSACADEMDLIKESIGVSELEQAAPREARALLDIEKVSDFSNLASVLERLWTRISGQGQDLFFSALRGGAQLLTVAFLTSLCSCLVPSETVSLAGALAVSLIALHSASSCAEVGKEALNTMSEYSHVLLPCMCTAATLSGGVTSAGAKYAVSVLFLDGVITAFSDYLFPLLSIYMAVILTGMITEHPFLISVSRLLKLCVKWALVLVTSGFTLFLSLTGILAGSVDAAAAKTAKTALSGALPVVGGMIADASAALISGAQMLCGSIGVMGMLVVLAVCILPYLTLGSHYLVYQLAGGTAAAFGDHRVGGVIKSLGDVYGFLLGMVGSVSVMLFVSVISFMKAVTA